MLNPSRRWLPRWRAAKLIPLLVVLCAVSSGACAARGGVPRPFPGAAVPPTAGRPATVPPAVDGAAGSEEVPPAAAEPSLPSLGALFSEIVSTALQFRGFPYRFGGSDPQGFDCSGFVQYVFGRHGLALPREVRDQFGLGRNVDRDEVKPGDLVFFETVSRGASHVGVAIGGDQFVHAPSSRGVVRVERFSVSYWARRFVGARRLGEIAAASQPELPGTVRLSK